MEHKELNTTLIYILSILGLLCCCIGGIGAVFAGIAFILAHSNLNKVKLEPEAYDIGKIKAMKTAKIVALVILIINILYMLRTIHVIYTVGWDELTEQAREAMESIQAD